MRKHNALQKKRDDIDSKKILRTSFQWLYAVILLLFGFVILFTVVFKVSFFRVNKGSETKNAFVLVSSIGSSPAVGDKVTVSSGNSGFLGQISALSGTEISFGSDKNSFANCIVYENVYMALHAYAKGIYSIVSYTLHFHRSLRIIYVKDFSSNSLLQLQRYD